MAKSPGITQIQVTDTFGTWLNKTNELVTLINNDVMTASVSGDTTVGNATLIGSFFANNVASNISSTNISRMTEIRQQIGNNNPINIADNINITVANNLPIKLTNSLGPKLRFDNSLRTWDIGHANSTGNSSFVYVCDNSVIVTINANGDIETTGRIISNGIVSTGSNSKYSAANGSMHVGC